MTDPWKEYAQDWLLFTEAGFIAVNQADEDAARKLFKVGQMLNPENTLPLIGFGYLHLHKLELKEAIKAFEDVLKKEPNNEMVKAFLGLCMGMMPTAVSQGEKFLEEMTKSDSSMIRELAATSLDFVERFVKKAPGPAEKGKP